MIDALTQNVNFDCVTNIIRLKYRKSEQIKKYEKDTIDDYLI